MDPGMMAAPMPMGIPPGMDPAAGMAPGAGAPVGNPYPSTDPAAVAQIISMLQQADHMKMQGDQDMVLQLLLGALSGEQMPTDAGFVEGSDMPMLPPEQMMM